MQILRETYFKHTGLDFQKKGASIMKANWKEHITTSPDVLRGKPHIKQTRIPVSLILGYLAAGKSHEEIIAEFPDLSKANIAACLDYARQLSEFEVAA